MLSNNVRSSLQYNNFPLIVRTNNSASARRARYFYDKSVRLSVRLSLWHTLAMYRNKCTLTQTLSIAR